MSTLGVTLAQDGAATAGLTTELLMLKEIFFGDIVGLDISGSTSLLCKKKKKPVVSFGCVKLIVK